MRPTRSKPKTTPRSLPVKPAPVVRRPQFNLLGLMIIMLICSVASAGIYYLMRAEANEEGMRLAALLFILAGPVLLLVGVSVLIALLKKFG
jgi:hypothetical protein